jgi:phthalate 4,5-dioxygenase
VLEGTIDSSHVAVLHADNLVSSGRRDIETTTPLDERRRSVRPSTDSRPRIEVEETGYGFHDAALHRPIEAGEGAASCSPGHAASRPARRLSPTRR